MRLLDRRRLAARMGGDQRRGSSATQTGLPQVHTNSSPAPHPEPVAGVSPAGRWTPAPRVMRRGARADRASPIASAARRRRWRPGLRRELDQLGPTMDAGQAQQRTPARAVEQPRVQGRPAGRVAGEEALGWRLQHGPEVQREQLEVRQPVPDVELRLSRKPRTVRMARRVSDLRTSAGSWPGRRSVRRARRACAARHGRQKVHPRTEDQTGRIVCTATRQKAS